jgi:catechol 2,3-dioxygenase-like lactoylglutathione lyase family enzyme
MAPRLDVVGLVVRDMAASIAFYRRLGFAFADGAEGEGHVETALSGGLRLVLDTIEIIHSFDPSWTPPTGGHRIALAFACDSPAEVDATFQGFIAAGYDGHLPPWDAFWGQRYATVHDPDGNAIELFADLAG